MICRSQYTWFTDLYERNICPVNYIIDPSCNLNHISIGNSMLRDKQCAEVPSVHKVTNQSKLGCGGMLRMQHMGTRFITRKQVEDTKSKEDCYEYFSRKCLHTGP